MKTQRIALAADGTFELGGSNFVIDCTRGARRPSDSHAFTVVKSEPYIRFYEELAIASPRGLLELGIFQGGSYVLLDKLFAPERMSAVELSATPIAPLVDYIARTPGRSAHFATSQSDPTALRRIVAEDLAGNLDLVIDDASHAYEHSRISFEVLFPLLAPHGMYIIEDWAWAHHPAYQGDDAPLAKRPALTNLLFEQIMLLGSTNLIAEIQVRKPFYVIRKSGMRTAPALKVWDRVANRGRNWPSV